MNYFRYILITVFCLLISGCGIKFWYNQLDWVVPWYLDDLVELSGQQENQLEQVLRLKTNWHRKQELPKYIEWLDQLEQDIEQDQAISRYQAHQDKLSYFYQSLLSEFSGDIINLVNTLTPQQIDEIEQNLSKDDNEWRESVDELSEQELLERRYERLKANVEEWLGSINQNQEMIVSQWAQQVMPSRELRLSYRKVWRAEMKKTLNQPKSQARDTQLLELIQNGQALQSEELKMIGQYNRKLTVFFIDKIYQEMEPKQKQSLLEKLREYKNDFNDLYQESSV
ncbi:MAG: DUF6279 family lipoprotein [Kangiellaceae bacterium]|jgi:hypothetical protein|nr:DUF6279 family lipoprotein [Kangiellaceae bacterium]